MRASSLDEGPQLRCAILSNDMEIGPVVNHLKDLLIAYALALPIGWEREKNERSAGLRTFPIVAIAACGFILATEQHLINHPEGSANIIGGVITGIGFIGGGAILKSGEQVRGTATAASLWTTGAIGVAVGLGRYEVAIMLSLVNLLTLRVLVPFKTQQDPGESTPESEG